MAEKNWKPRFSPWLIATVVSISAFMELFDSTVANIALPHIAGSFSASIDESTWVITSYIVGNAVIIPLTPWFATLLGRKQFYMICIFLFTFTSMLCGLSTSFPLLIFFRVIQGVSGGGLLPSAQAILVDSFAPQQLGAAIAFYSVSGIFAPTIAPVVGGWITNSFSWRWIFLINVPIGIVSMFLVSWIVEDPPFLERKSFKQGLRIDYVGIALLSLGIANLQVVLDRGQQENWSAWILALAVIACLCFLVGIVWELREKEPAVDLRLLKDRNFALANILMLLLGALFMGSMTIFSVFLQTLIHYTAIQAGWALTPGGMILMLEIPIVAFVLIKYFDARILVGAGFLIASLSLFMMAGAFDLSVDFYTAVTYRIFQSAGLPLIWVPINVVAYRFIPKEKTSKAASFLVLSRYLGGSFGISLAITYVARASQFYQTMMVRHVTMGAPQFQTALYKLNALLARVVQPVAVNGLSINLIYHELLDQARMLAYLDLLRVFGALLLGAVALAALFKKN